MSSCHSLDVRCASDKIALSDKCIEWPDDTAVRSGPAACMIDLSSADEREVLG